jgi:hypothetical protein
MDADELLKRYASGKRDFTWVDLTEADLTGAKLTGINLSRANLTRAILAKADLSQANLTKANLSEANLRKANLTRSKLYKANLSAAQLDATDLTGADLSGVNLDTANLSGATMPDGTPYEHWLLSQQSEEALLVEETSVSADDQPLATPQMSANEPIVEIATPPGIVEPSRTMPLRERLTAKESRQSWFPLILLWLGYFFFGQLLTFHNAVLIAWIVAWAGSLIWVIDESLIWFVPLTGAIAVMGSVTMSIVSVVVTATITLMMIGGMIVLDFGVRKALKDGLWVGGLVAAAMLIASWLLEDSNAFGGGGVVLTGTFPMALGLLFAIVAVTFGSMSWKAMDYLGFTKKQTIQTFAGVTGLGLFCGWVIEMLF